MENPLRRRRRKVFLGGEGMRLLWRLFPQAAFFEVYVPMREGGTRPELPLIVESTESRLVEPYTKMFYRLFTARETPIVRLLFMNVNGDASVAQRVAANLAITLASEDIVTYLVDLEVREPALHEIFHVSRTPGMVEYLLKGANAGEVVRSTGVPELKFVPSGGNLEDPDSFLSILGWRMTLERLIPSGVVGLINVGCGRGFDMSELMAEVDGTLLLFSSGEKIDRSARKVLKHVKKWTEVLGVIWTNPMEYPVRGPAISPFREPRAVEEQLEEEAVPALGRPQSAMEHEGGIEPPEGSPAVGIETESAGGRVQERGEEGDAPAEAGRMDREDGDSAPEEGGAGEEHFPEEPARRGSSRAIAYAVLGIVTIALLWGISRWRRPATEEGSPVLLQEETPREAVPGSQAPAGLAGAGENIVAPEGAGIENVPSSPASRDLPYSLVLGSFRESAAAVRGKGELSKAGFDVYLVPVEIPGRGRWIRLMEGWYPDREAARDRLKVIGGETSFKEGRVVEASLAYRLGEYTSEESAASARERVRKEGLDPYIVRSAGEDPDYTLYLGAFEGKAQSAAVKIILDDHGLAGELVNRRGRDR